MQIQIATHGSSWKIIQADWHCQAHMQEIPALSSYIMHLAHYEAFTSNQYHLIHDNIWSIMFEPIRTSVCKITSFATVMNVIMQNFKCGKWGYTHLTQRQSNYATYISSPAIIWKWSMILLTSGRLISTSMILLFRASRAAPH